VVACRRNPERFRQPSLERSGAAVSPYGSRSRFEKAARYFNQNTKVPLEEASSRTPLHDTYGIITPSSLHFERHHSGVPEIDPSCIPSRSMDGSTGRWSSPWTNCVACRRSRASTSSSAPATAAASGEVDQPNPTCSAYMA